MEGKIEKFTINALLKYEIDRHYDPKNFTQSDCHFKPEGVFLKCPIIIFYNFSKIFQNRGMILPPFHKNPQILL